MANKFIVDSNSEALDPQDVEKLIQKMVKISCEFDVYFQNQSVSPFHLLNSFLFMSGNRSNQRTHLLFIFNFQMIHL